MQLCASSDGPPWSYPGVVLLQFIADHEICDQQHNTQSVGCFFTFQVIVNNELNFSAQNTHFVQQEDSPVKMCFILYTLGLDATKGSAILYNMVCYLSCNVTSTWSIRASSESKPRSTSLLELSAKHSVLKVTTWTWNANLRSSTWLRNTFLRLEIEYKDWENFLATGFSHENKVVPGRTTVCSFRRLERSFVLPIFEIRSGPEGPVSTQLEIAHSMT